MTGFPPRSATILTARKSPGCLVGDGYYSIQVVEYMSYNETVEERFLVSHACSELVTFLEIKYASSWGKVLRTKCGSGARGSVNNLIGLRKAILSPTIAG